MVLLALTARLWLALSLAAGLNASTVRVVPPPVDAASLHVDWSWDGFNISWSAARVNHAAAHVNYTLFMSYAHNTQSVNLSREMSHTYAHIAHRVPAYTPVLFTLKACTHWGCSPPSSRAFVTPMAAPSMPQRPRVFVTHHQHYRSRDTTIDLDFRWDPPAVFNGVLSRYEVQWAHARGATSAADVSWFLSNHTNELSLHHGLSPAYHNANYYFKVRACTVECGPETAVVQCNTKVAKPVPTLLTTTSESISMFYPDQRNSQPLAATVAGGALSVAFIAHEATIYWLNRKGRIMKRSQKDTTEVVMVNGTGRDLTADWISRDLYWLVQKPSGHSDIMRYDLNKNTGRPLLVLRRVDVLWKMAVNPYQSTLYWTETTPEGRGLMMTCKKDGSGPRALLRGRRGRKKGGRRKGSRRRHRRQQPVPEPDEECDCPELYVSPVFVMDHTVRDSPVMFVVEQDTSSIWSSDLDGCRCRLLVNATSQTTDYGLPPDSLTVDHDRVYWANRQKRVVNSVLKATGSGFHREETGQVDTILAYGDHIQPMPDTACLLAGDYDQAPELVAKTNSSLSLRFEEWRPPAGGCSGLSRPSIKYSLHFRQTSATDHRACSHPEVRCVVKTSFEPRLELDGLEPFAWYSLQVSVSNFYTDSMERRTVLGPPAKYQTAPGIPSAPRDVVAEPSTPNAANITWKTPARPNGNLSSLVYVIDWHTFTNGSQRRGSETARPRVVNVTTDGKYLYDIVSGLQAGQKYYFRVLAYDREMRGGSGSRTVMTDTYHYPSAPRLLDRTQTTITIGWRSLPDDSIARHIFEYTKVSDQPHWDRQNFQFDQMGTRNATRYNETFTGLAANKEYAFRVGVVYRGHIQYFVWPTTMRYVFKTAADVPGTPLAPGVRHTASGVQMVVWEAPTDGGSPILAYTLHARLVDGGGNWSMVYNGSKTQWVVSPAEEEAAAEEQLVEGESYVFRVAAINDIGCSQYSANSSALSVKIWLAPSDKLTEIMAWCFSVIVFLIMAALIIFLIVWFRRYKDHKVLPGFHLMTGFRSVMSDMELETLRELPRVARQQTNALYAVNIVPTKEDIEALPHFRRDQLTLTKFLGGGAFGEVFEGVARNILAPDSGETRVAVKTLRKGASEQEKEEFLKEALLMSNFKHEHILRLLGVCLDNDPQFIILELMEGGDLLSYLRTARSTPNGSAKLLLPGMVGICVDVSKGCRYLEDMHFVHRDLAARNCLVSNGCRERVVKIGDFGLARDIYKNDYYRKEGEGLLPVRWMSPESLIDGVFSTQSDVWAFGVLMWEVLTLGQQPYPARTNLEVLHFVRNGGRLDRPEVCPDDLYALMLKCWAYDPDQRPSFHYMLDQLEAFKLLCADPSSPFARMGPPTGSTEAPRPPSRAGRLRMLLSPDSHAQGLKKSANRRDARPPKEDSGYLQPLVQPADKHKYLELVEDEARHRPGHDPKRLSPPREPAPAPPLGLRLGALGPAPPPPTDARPKQPHDTTGLGLNHWPQTNIPALPLPPPRDAVALRESLREAERARESRFDRNGKRRSSSLNSRPARREQEEDSRNGRVYPGRDELRKTGAAPRRRGVPRAHSAGSRADCRSRRKAPAKTPPAESSC